MIKRQKVKNTIEKKKMCTNRSIAVYISKILYEFLFGFVA
jgi:hypothetical protein